MLIVMLLHLRSKLSFMFTMPSFHLDVHNASYLKNPESSELGKKIMLASIDMIDDLGFDNFTFRKLGKEIESTEASIYRYFENKHKLLIYLTNWYWSWLEYQLVFAVANITEPEERLHRAMDVITRKVDRDSNFLHIDEVKLQRIVIAESPKAYLTKDVDDENRDGLFLGYKRLVQHVCDIILELNPDFKYPNMLVSTVIEGALQQRFFSEHLPRLTNVVAGEDAIMSFYKQLVFKILDK